MATIDKSKVFSQRDKWFKGALAFNSYFLVALLVGVFLTLLIAAIPAIKEFGISFLFSTEWDPMNDVYGALPFIVGTLISSLLALLISVPFSLSIALLLGEYSPKGFLPAFVRTVIELMAGVPSVIYGFWGLFFLVPLMQEFQIYLMDTPIGESWDIIPTGVGILTSALILAVMIIPFSASLAREIIMMVPGNLKEAAYSLGSTRFEVITRVVIPYAKSGIIAGFLLSLGRALGETMAVTMLIGNSNEIPTNIFSMANTMASVIANEFGEAEDMLLSALFEVGLVLFVISLLINIVGRTVILKMDHKVGR
jgi:phosphate transport system permease protein